MAGSNFHIFGIEEITLYIKHKLSSDENLLDIWVHGEISNFVHHTSGHFYFTLKDERSQLPCAMFRWANEGLKFEPENGMKVMTKGSIDVYAPRGRYNFVVTQVHPKGVGELYIRFLQLKERLTKEGLFDVKFKQPIPRFPQRIGIITSPTGAALQDIVNILRRRFPCAEILVVPTLVQGENAANDIVRSIRVLNEFGDVDVAIVGRGGGSIEDLWPFNEEIVARAIFQSNVPIISAVGHETDFTISDFVADLRAATPSSAAELVVPHKNEVAGQINALRGAMLQSLQMRLRMHKTRLEAQSSVLKPRLLMDRVIQFQQRTDGASSKLIMQMNHHLEMCQGRFNALSEMLDAVSPLSTLRRGYTITLKLPEESAIDSVDKAGSGDEVKVIFQDGEMRCKVNSVSKSDVLTRAKALEYDIAKNYEKDEKPG